MFKKICSIIFTLIFLSNLVGCEKNLHFSSNNTSKDTPATVMTIDLPNSISCDEQLQCTIGIGLSPAAKYEKNITDEPYNNYIETVFTVSGENITINDCKDSFTKSYDITDPKYHCTDDNNPIYFFEIIIDFSNVQKSEGEILITTISHFENNERTGSGTQIHYQIKNNKIKFSLA